jgi:hypothetical protein
MKKMMLTKNRKRVKLRMPKNNQIVFKSKLRVMKKQPIWLNGKLISRMPSTHSVALSIKLMEAD